MGCCIPTDSEKYFEFTKNDEERDFRLWEKKLGFYRNTFKNLQALLMLDERKTTNKEALKVVLTRNFSDGFSKLLDSEFLKSEDGQIKNDKLILLVFLASIHTLNRAGNVLYCDKALFLFTLINKRQEVEANAPIEKTNENLRKLIERLFDLSAIELYTEYSKSQTNIRDGMFKQIEKYRSYIIDRILNSLFESKSGELTSLSFTEFNMMFMRHPNLFTTGYFRSQALDYFNSTEFGELKAKELKK